MPASKDAENSDVFESDADSMLPRIFEEPTAICVEYDISEIQVCALLS